MPANTSAASASCGIHFGLTKLVASIVRSPVPERRSINSILALAAMIVFSFCRPSRGPTSTMRTASFMASRFPWPRRNRIESSLKNPGESSSLGCGPPVMRFCRFWSSLLTCPGICPSMMRWAIALSSGMFKTSSPFLNS